MTAQPQNPPLDYDSVVIGGGFFGSEIARNLESRGERVLLVEKEPRLMQRASSTNQARVHNGYHYPRSLLTALRSRVSFPRFVRDYPDAIYTEFEQYYAIARTFSNVTARQYLRFCERIGAEISEAPEDVRKLFDDTLIEDVFVVTEAAFDPAKLALMVADKLAASSARVLLSTSAVYVTRRSCGIQVGLDGIDSPESVLARRVFNCTYSRINALNHSSSLPLVPLKQELAEVILVDVPDELRSRGVTIMDGPFFSIMPFPGTGRHSFTHVRYTPHTDWEDAASGYVDPHEYISQQPPSTAFPKMLADAKRYLPIMSNVSYDKSLWEVKTVLSKSERDDSRPILFRTYSELPGYICVLGGKIDNVYDVIGELEGENVSA
jgi:glycine/D-amino acid oxidase-like deaminating enzyme